MSQEITLDQCIIFLAKHGSSKHAVAKTLNIRFEAFLEMCKLLPEAQWVPKGQTIGDLQARKKNRRKCSDRKREALKIAMANSREAKKRHAFGRTGTIKELTEWFGRVTYDSVIRRLGKGESLESALITPRRVRQPRITKHEEKAASSKS